MKILYLITAILLFLLCCVSFIIQVTLEYYIPAVLDVFGGAISGFCIHISYLSYRGHLLKWYSLETLKRICNFKYVFLIIVLCITGYHVSYLVVHRDAFDNETRFIALQLGATISSVALLIRVLMVIKKEVFVNAFTIDELT